MFLFELVIALLLVGAILALCAPRIGVPYPALLALAGAALALISGVPEVALDPELALALFVAPTRLRMVGQRGLGVNSAALVTSCAVCRRIFSSLQCARRSLRSG
jgi:hypothetical protein